MTTLTATSKPEWLIKAQAEADRRFASVNWQHGKWYGIYDEDEGANTQLFFKCEIDGDETYLVEDQYDCDKHLIPEAYVARDKFTSATVVVEL